MKLYSISNTLTRQFNPPFVARDDVDAKEVVRKAIMVGRDISLLVELENLDLAYVGDFNAETGMLLPAYDELPFKVCSLSEIPLPEHIQVLVDKLHKVEADVDTNGIKSFFYKLLEKVDKKQKKEVKKKEEEENCSSQ